MIKHLAKKFQSGNVNCSEEKREINISLSVSIGKHVNEINEKV